MSFARGQPRSRFARLGAFAVAGGAGLLLNCSTAGTVTEQKQERERVAKVTSPLWESSVKPIRIRSNHTSTIFGTGEILVAGGASTPKSTEIIDPYQSTVTAGPELLFEHASHTATMLPTGKVLLAGGNANGSCELFDPIAKTFTATGAMQKPRKSHVAIRLRSGKVLAIGAGNGTNTDTSCELYDPAAGTWTLGPARLLDHVGAAATLNNGNVLVVDVEDANNRTEIYDPVASTWSATNSLPQGFGTATLTRLHDNRVLVGYTTGCASAGGPVFCNSTTFFFSTALAQTGSGPDFMFGRDDGFSAARTPKGEVVFIGGDPNGTQKTAERFDPAAPAALVQDGDLSVVHRFATSTILPGGDILSIGGSQAAIDRRVTFGSWRKPAALKMLHGRVKHASVRLHDGGILVAGGEGGDPADATFTGKEADLIDVAAGTVVPAGVMSIARTLHTMTPLRSGKVLVLGGQGQAGAALLSAELYDPAAAVASRFKALPSMSVARSNHAATLLPTGDVLITGGDAAAGTSAELYVDATSTFAPLPKMNEPRSRHGAVLMQTGKVLIVSGSTAEIFDPVAKTFRPTTPPGAAGRDGRTTHVLPSGKVFVVGGSTLAADLFDPVSETWSFSGGAQDLAIADMLWTGLPDGRVVTSGGHFPIDGALSLPYIFDAIASPAGGSFVTMPTRAQSVYLQSAALSGTGEAVITGGNSCFGACIAFPSTDVSVFGDDAPVAVRPVITQVATKVTPGAKVAITGTGFANGAEASDGKRGSSAVNHPLAIWMSDSGDASIRGTITDFTNTTATWIVPPTAHYGHGQLFVSTAGVLSRGASVEIESAPQALTCAFGAECTTGFCVDGVCCDRQCDGVCEACSTARKLSGADGVCGAIPPGKDNTGRCVLKLGDACTAKEECGPNFCSQGVCCDSSCEGQCLACNQAGKAGRCSAINEGVCGATCDGDHTLKQVGAPDVDCAPFKCAGPRCNNTCTSVRDCVAPAVCSLEGQCVPGTLNAPGNDTVCGCRVIGAPATSSSSSTTFAAIAAAALAAAHRRRRRRRARAR